MESLRNIKLFHYHPSSIISKEKKNRNKSRKELKDLFLEQQKQDESMIDQGLQSKYKSA